MLASVIIEYSVKSLNKVFDYKIPEDLKDIIRVGHKVIVPFGKVEVEGFVLKIHNNIDNTYCVIALILCHNVFVFETSNL